MYYRQLRDAEPGLIEVAARGWQRWHAALQDQRDGFANQVVTPLSDPSIWYGLAAAAARTYLGDVRATLRYAVDEMEPIAGVCSALAGEIGRCQTMLRDLEARVAGRGLIVGDDGAVIIPPGMPLTGEMTRESLAADAQQLGDELNDVLRRATQAELAAVEALDKFSVQDMDPAAVGSRRAPSVPKPGTRPQQVHAWWDGLTPGQQQSLVETHPARIGSLDGIPTEARDAANRLVLATAKQRLLHQREELEIGRPGDMNTRGDRIRAIDAKLQGITAVEERLDQPQPGRQQAYLLGLDTGNLGQAIVAVGNPDEADNVVTFVPGTYSSLGGAGSGLDKVDAMVDQAQRIDPHARTAGVLWIGYDAPQSLGDAADASYAESAGATLDGFQDGLRATHEGPPSNNTVVAHSYGSTVVGVTARDEGLDVDNAVLVGSPGVGVDHARELGLHAGNVWATRADNDIIQHAYDPGDLQTPVHPQVPTGVPNPDPDLVHGNDPTDPDFGGRVFASDPGTSMWRNPRAAHLEYW
ncbi:MAG: alpha/beta hydrolase, partial [Pseudonocardiaceae bacterium]